MNRTATRIVKSSALVAAAAVLTLSSGCRVERTTGQRHQARAIDTILRAEAMRLNEEPLSETTLEDYAHLNAMYQDLLHAAIRSGEAEPLSVQEAEDLLSEVASEARMLPAFQEWSPEAQKNFEENFWRFRLKKWQQWRGPDYIYE
jgi:predicted nucleic-acid-binding protein